MYKKLSSDLFFITWTNTSTSLPPPGKISQIPDLFEGLCVGQFEELSKAKESLSFSKVSNIV